MSAFLCSNRHTAVLAILAHSPGTVHTAQIEETARILRALNDAALHARYGDAPNPLTRAELKQCIPAAAEWLRHANPPDMLAAAKCFAYQCAEDIPDDYPGQSILADILARVEKIPGARVESSIWSI